MTTASRPTFAPAMGGSGKGETSLSSMSKQYSSRDLASQTKLKYREVGQGSADEVRNKDLKRDLEERERQTKDKAERKDRDRDRSAKTIAPAPTAQKKPRSEPAANLDADDPVEEDSDDSNDDDDEDDTAELMAELQRIKAERAAEMARKELEQRQEEERIRMENILSGNPLLNYSSKAQKSDLRVKRRWDDDVVFKNCSRAEPERKPNQFINDSLRSEFHKKFMDKYIK
uniref:EOG090X0IT3 n=1 Tax=Moina brachiata TaxID=675436 RepID=A0A4Y7NL99_9CRUS|nr:EOG090X0IT3 [Moina brachiata]SVE93374.1 EOG090X0IT3 [Moina brachiata]